MTKTPPSEGIQYGFGLFETLRVHKGRVQNIRGHHKRLAASLASLGMASLTYDQMVLLLEDYIKDCDHGVVKLLGLKNKDQVDWTLTSRVNPYGPDLYKRGYRVVRSTYPRHSKNPLVYHKTTNYLANILEKEDINKQGLDEAIHLNEGDFLTEGIFSNVFFVTNDVLYTPVVEAGLLPGTQRQRIIDFAKERGIPLQEGYYKEEALIEADEVFFTNAILGIMPVKTYESKQYDLNTNHFTRSLMEAYQDGLL